MRKYASAEERAAKNQKTTVRHFGFTEKVYGLPCMATLKRRTALLRTTRDAKRKKASGARSQCGMKLQCLASRNGCVAHVNNQLLDDFSGDVVVYKSIDTVPDQNAVTYPTKFLNSLELSGMPPHILKLKVGAPVMVLQNINQLYLCNGTRCIVRILDAIALK